MKGFFSKYSYSVVKMLINQFAIGIFGAVLSMATTTAGSDPLTIVVSIFAILFYLFLIYNMMWEIGAKDRLAVDYKKQPYRPHTGLIIALIANIPNFLIAISQTVTAPFMGMKWANALRSGTLVVYLVLEGMYLGLCGTWTISVGGVATSLQSFWWMYYIIIVPALVTSWLAYYIGHKNFRILSLFGVVPKNPDQGKKKS